MIVYEYPFNEQIRTFLRLEDLCEKFSHFIQYDHPLQHHVALTTLFEMLEVASRADLKSDLLQELERQRQMLLGFKTNPNVETIALHALLTNIDEASSQLVAIQGKIGQHLRENEWLMSIRGRTIIPGGACEFDVPSYYAWQRRPVEQRLHDINQWFAPMLPLFNGLTIILKLLRESGSTTKIIAVSGSYQQNFQGKGYQMLRINLDPALNAIPEISANKYMLWVRFTSPSEEMKLKTYDQDLPFELTLCNF